MFSRKNKNLPNKEYPASASEPRTRSKSHLSAMSGVYAGPDAMSNRVPMDTVYAGPDEMSGRTPMAPVYAGPDEMNGRVPSGAFTDPRFNIAPPPEESESANCNDGLCRSRANEQLQSD